MAMTTEIIHTRVQGVTARNDDGRARQDCIRAVCRAGMRLMLRREPNNRFDENAIGVWIKVRARWVFTDEVQIGYISAALAAELARWLDSGNSISAEISEVTGGRHGNETLGVNILLQKIAYGRRSAPARPNVGATVSA
jgi:hypothetical protein